jgi:hypothetical protein
MDWTYPLFSRRSHPPNRLGYYASADWVEWNRDTPIAAVYSPKTGTIHATYNKCRTGDHKSDGLFFAAGPSIRPGPIEHSLSVMDFAPTISTLLGVENHQFQGRSLVPFIGT